MALGISLQKKGITKGNAIDVICKHLNISTKEIIAFGDDYADIEMLEIAGTGVAMGNAVKELKDIADICIDSNENDGIAKYLEEYLANTQ